MLNRTDMLELTRRMTPERSSVDRIAGCYIDEEGYIDGTFNRHFLNLSPSERSKNLLLAKAVPFSETNRQLIELDFPGETKDSGDMMRLLDTIKESGLKNDAMLEVFYEVASEKLPKGREYAIFLFHGIYDIPRIGKDKKEQWESEEIYEYLICTVMPVSGEYETGAPFCGFLYPSFKDRSADIFHIAVFSAEEGAFRDSLISLLGCE